MPADALPQPWPTQAPPPETPATPSSEFLHLSHPNVTGPVAVSLPEVGRHLTLGWRVAEPDEER